MIEEWKAIPGYEAYYQISSFGRVRRLVYKTGPKIEYLKSINKAGYPSVDLCMNNKRKKHTIHRLIAEAFIPNPDNKEQINHINGIKSDFRISNLEWVTHRENSIHAMSNGLHPVDANKIMTRERIEKVFKLRGDGLSQYEIANKLNVNQSVISRVLNKKRERYLLTN